VERLAEAGLNPVNNVVDVTQWVLWELGHPLHAFDYDTLADKQLLVRLARPDEKLVTLDEQERQLDPSMLLVCDSQKPAAVAGILGGLESGVDAATHNVVIEAAYFDPRSIRRTAKKLAVSTEASKRFERSVDPLGALYACDLAAQMIQQVAGGEISKGRLEVRHGTVERRVVKCRLERVNALLGTRLSLGEVEGLLKRLDFEVKADANETLRVTVPTYRTDVEI
jgi:phenylalanyl-tRNA synthetase beta chain